MKERNLLFGLMAVHEKKIPLDSLAEVAEKTLSAEVDLGSLLAAAGTISEEDRKALESYVDQTIQKHGGIEPALRAMNADADSLRTLSQSLYGDSSHAETLMAQPFADRSQMETIDTAATSDRSAMETIATAPTGDRSSMETIATAPTGDRSSMETINTDANATTPMMRNPGDSVTLVALHGAPGSRPRSDMPVPAVQEHPGRYHHIKVLMAGGMGQINIVHDHHLGRDIALKTLLPDRVPGNSRNRTRTGAPTMEVLTVPIIARFLQEAHITGQLEHPNIIPIYELGYKDDGTIYYTMKFVRGQSIQDKLKEAKDLKDRLLLLTHFLNMCQAIAYAHSRGVIHRDLKPMNVMVGEFGETTVIDWGIAKVKGETDIHEKGLRETVKVMQVGDTQATAKTQYGQTMGSPYYMPPEQAAGRTDEIDEYADIYALGAILYVILTGQAPYQGMNVREFLVKVQQFDPKPVLEVEPNAPKELAAIVGKAMQRRREDRYSSASELAAEIEKFLSGGLVSAYEYSAMELFKRWYKRNRILVNSTLVASVLLLSLGVWSYIAIGKQRDIAVINEQEAIKQRGIAVVEKDNAQREFYFASVNLAHGSLEDSVPGKGRAQLAAAPEPYYNWEWGHLQQALNADSMTLKAGGQYAGYGDGILVVSAGFGKTEVYDSATGEKLHELLEKAGTGFAFDFSPASGRVLVLGEDGAHVWDAKSGTEVYRFEEVNKQPGRQILRQASLSADGKRLAMLGFDRTARVIDIDSKAELYTTAFEMEKGALLQLSADGQRLLVVKTVLGAERMEQGFEVIDLSNGGASLGTATMPEETTIINAATFSSDGSLIALGTSNDLQVWSVAPFEKASSIDGLRFTVPRTVAFSPDGTLVAGGTSDGVLGIWQLATGKAVVQPKAHLEGVRAVAFSPDGAYVASASNDQTTRLWALPNWDNPKLRPAHTFIGHDGSIYGLSFAPDGGQLLTTSVDKTSKVWDLKAEAEFHVPEVLAFSPANDWTAGALGNDVALWDARTGYRLATLSGHTLPVMDVLFAQGSTHLATLGTGKDATEDEVKVWSLPSGEAAGALALPKGKAKTRLIGLVQGGAKLLYRQGSDLRVVNVADGTAAFEAKVSGAVTVNKEGTLAAYAVQNPDDKTAYQLHVLDLASLADKASFDLKSADILPLTFDPTGQWLATATWEKSEGDDNTLRAALLPAAGGAPVLLDTGHGNGIEEIAFTPDGALFATGSRDGTIEVFDTASKTRKVVLEKGHTSNVVSISFSPDGSRLASASLDGTFLLWNVERGNPVLTVQNKAQRAEGQVVTPGYVAFNAKGDLLATLTDGELVPPFVNKSFPWKLSDYPAGETLQDRVEGLKRSR